jgi:hypothetical protein
MSDFIIPISKVPRTGQRRASLAFLKVKIFIAKTPGKAPRLLVMAGKATTKPRSHQVVMCFLHKKLRVFEALW